MKKIIFVFLLVPFLLSGQEIGRMAEEKPPVIFPDDSWGMDLMFGEGGFGLGTFLRHKFSRDFSGFVDISFSESKDDKEVEYINYWGQTVVYGKKNRVFLVPLNFGVQQRLFSESVAANLRPYLMAGAGPTMLVVTPYDQEFFKSFGDAATRFAVGGYVGFGANFGMSKENLVGLNFRYYYSHLFGDGVENMENRKRNNFGGFYITLNLGLMY